MNTEQFDGHTPGPWRVMATGDGRMVGIRYGTEEEPPHEPIRAVGSDSVWTDWGAADARLIAAAPELLAEVKRLGHRLMLAESALGEIRAYHESGQGNLGEIIEHYRENEQVEMPNAFNEEDEE